MPQDLLDFLRVLMPAFIGAATAYAAIRSDLARLQERTDNAKASADQAHQRIDEILGRK